MSRAGGFSLSNLAGRIKDGTVTGGDVDSMSSMFGQLQNGTGSLRRPTRRCGAGLSSAEKTAQEGLIMAVAVTLDRALVTLAAHGG